MTDSFPATPSGRPRLPWGLTLGLGALLAANSLLPLLYGRLPGAMVLDYGTVFLLAGLAAGLAWRRARREGPRAFGWIGLGAALGGLRFLPTLLGLPHAAFLGPAFSLAGLVALGAGFLTWPQQTRLPRDRFRTTLDGAALAVALFTLAWMILEPSTRIGPVPLARMLVYLVQISVCAGVLALWLLQETRLVLPQQARAKALVRGALMALLVHSLLATLLRAMGWYYPGYLGHGTEVLHQLAIALIALAAVCVDPGSRPAALRATSALRALIPSAVSLMVLVGALVQLRSAAPLDARVLVGLILALLALVALRHGLQILDLEALSRGLEQRVADRTRALEAHHQQALGDLRVRMMAGLAAGLAHDLNNILGVVRLRIDLLKEARLPAQAEDLRVLTEATERAIALAQRILLSGRPQELSPAPLPLGPWLLQKRTFLQALLLPGQTLTLALEAGGTAFVDEPSLEQVLENLVTNARDAMDPTGHLRLALGGDPGRIRLVVEDDGPGIPPELLPRLFEPFFTTKARGTGLGLPTVRNLVLQNRGSIQVDSAPGLGTRVLLDFPTGPWPGRNAC